MREAHLAESYEVTPAKDGESLGIKFVMSDGSECYVGLRLERVHEFVDEVSKGIEICAAGSAAAKQDPPTSTLQ